MWLDSWAVLPESDRAQWDHAPRERVGPLRFGMALREAAVAMEAWAHTTFDCIPAEEWKVH